jgi:DNA polymerase III subunit beta
MNLTIARGELWRGIDTVLDAVPSKPALPILSNLLLVADDRGLSLAATDLDMSIRTRVDADVHEAGSITVPARALAEITREWPEAELAIQVTDHTLKLSGALGDGDTGEGSYQLPGMPPDDFPAIPPELSGLKVDLAAVEGLDTSQIAQMVQRTAFAVSRDDTRPVLNGALWRVQADGLLMVATDGHRFAHFRRAMDLTDQVQGEGSEAIVPPPALSQIAKLLGGAGDVLSLTLGDSQLLFDVGHTQLLSRLIEGPYVDYKQVIPGNNDKPLRVPTGQILSAVRRVSILSSTYTHQIKLSLKSGTVELSANSPEIGGDAREMIPVDYTDEEMEIAYNAQYLMEILRRMDTEQVDFMLSNEVTAAVLRPAAADDGQEYFCLLMPLRSTG